MGLPISTGELVVVFDADHAPARDFLDCTVGFFRTDPAPLPRSDPAFLSESRSDRKKSPHLPENAVPKTKCFYGVIQRGLDKWNASFFCGSAAVLRRSRPSPKPMGFQGRSITEDCETGARTARARLAQHLCRQASHRRSSTRNLRKLHCAAFALVARHDPDSFCSKSRS